MLCFQVFGNSGTRPFREVASEAETPKRSGSGITQEAEAGTSAKFRPFEALANAMSEAHTASTKSEELTQMVLHLNQVIHDEGTVVMPSCIMP